ncbi:hypothetical protein E2C01_011931 [Portunus trituberculatus]|uniref:Uncharacterized protein n=1 Tax=Portunus trituberculatus TaxID=210409 RepID=A0A5B7DCL9_PORTR|nr:hypothetical protein [Portunus trituberculatus]
MDAANTHNFPYQRTTPHHTIACHAKPPPPSLLHLIFIRPLRLHPTHSTLNPFIFHPVSSSHL